LENLSEEQNSIEYVFGKPIDPSIIKKGIIDGCEMEVKNHNNTASKWLELDLKRTEACPICGGNDFKDFVTIRGLKWVSCDNCTHHFAAQYPTSSELARFYKNHSGDGKLSPYRLEDEKTLKSRMENIDKPKFDSIEAHTQKPGRWLDIGAGLGNMLFYAKEKGWDVCGLELSQHYIDSAKQNFDLNLVKKDLISFVEEDTPEPFDVVTALGLLDLIDDPIAALKLMRKVIKDDGLLIVSTPNANSFTSKLTQQWPESEIRSIISVNRSLFTEKSLTYALKQAGFGTFKCWYFGLDFFALFLHLCIKNKGFESSSAGDFMLRKFSEFQAVIDKNKLSDSMILYSHVKNS
jgi:SAM-dependent methyltransferase